MNVLTKIYTAIMSREPVATVGVLRQLFFALIALGWTHLTTEQVGVSLIFVESLLTWLVRANVVTDAKHAATVNAALQLPAGSTRSDLAAAVAVDEGKTP